MKVLVTGAAGFIGFHLVKALLLRGDEVVGLDNLNAYYDTSLKARRLQELGISSRSPDKGVLVNGAPGFRFIALDLEDSNALYRLCAAEQFGRVCHLAAQAGVRYSLENPAAYIQSNLVGFANLLEVCRAFPPGHLVYASSSSVYGIHRQPSFSISQATDHPASLYAATKKSNELMAHTYSHLFGLPTTALRFFTVYGPWGRPDMAPFLFTKAISEGKTIKVFNHGQMERDFTYIDDIISGVLLAIDNPATPNPLWNGAEPDPATSSAPYRVFNLGNSQPVHLMDFIHAIEETLGKKAQCEFLPLQPGDVLRTCSDISETTQQLGYMPTIPVSEGVARFVKWYRNYYL
ncbi:MAG: NAD-dependent epimerase [Bacteroidales bacterium]